MDTLYVHRLAFARRGFPVMMQFSLVDAGVCPVPSAFFLRKCHGCFDARNPCCRCFCRHHDDVHGTQSILFGHV